MTLRNMITRIKNKIENYLFNEYGIPNSRREVIAKQALKKYLPKQPITIDCGSYDGSDTVELYKVLGGTVHAFEAVPSIYKRLVKNTENNPNIKTYNLALSNITGEQTFYISEGSSDASSSLLPPKEHLIDHPDTSFKDAVTVQTRTLDDWASENGIDHVDFLWLDMQGFEMDVLMVSKKIFPTVKAIHSEVSVKETYEGVRQYQEFKEWLISQGFSVEIEAIPHGWDMGNVLFVKNNNK